MLSAEFQQHLDAIKVDQAQLDRLERDATVTGALDKVLIAMEPALMATLEGGETLAEGFVPGGALTGMAMRFGTKLLESAIHRKIAALSVNR